MLCSALLGKASNTLNFPLELAFRNRFSKSPSSPSLKFAPQNSVPARHGSGSKITTEIATSSQYNIQQNWFDCVPRLREAFLILSQILLRRCQVTLSGGLRLAALCVRLLRRIHVLVCELNGIGEGLLQHLEVVFRRGFLRHVIRTIPA